MKFLILISLVHATVLTPQQWATKYPQSGTAREAASVREIIGGNTPSWAFDLETVGAMQVMPDYLSIGSDTNFMRMPLTVYAAQYLASYYNMKCPTPKAVDLIWKVAKIKVTPITKDWNYVAPITGDLSVRFLAHSGLIGPHAGFTAGDKKDVVATAPSGKVAIYGWQNPSGSNIQPLFTGHGWFYSDYAHGLRLIRTDDKTLGGPCTLDKAPAEFTNLVGAK